MNRESEESIGRCENLQVDFHYCKINRIRWYAVPEAVRAFLEGTDFEDVVRTAVSLGGDCDTLTAIAASIGEAYYGIPEWRKKECRDRLEEDMLEVVDLFDHALRCQPA